MKVYGTRDGEWMKCHQCGTDAVHFGSRWAHTPEDCVRALSLKIRETREKAMRDVLTDLVAWLRMSDEEYDKTHETATKLAHATAATIESYYLNGTRISRLLDR